MSKKQWAILLLASFFNLKTQVRIISACCVIHNYVLDEQREWDDLSLNEVEVDLTTATMAGNDVSDDEVIRHVQVSVDRVRGIKNV